MAYANIFKNNTYSYIDNVLINKNNKVYSFNFSVYENENKENLIFEKNYNFYCKDLKCKVINKIYTSLDEIKENLNEIYYYNLDDKTYLPGFYNSIIESYIEINAITQEEIIKERIKMEIVYTYSSFYFENEYYKVTNKEKFNGLNTDYYFNNIIYPSINLNIIEVLYNTLEIIEPSYKDYPKI